MKESITERIGYSFLSSYIFLHLLSRGWELGRVLPEAAPAFPRQKPPATFQQACLIP